MRRKTLDDMFQYIPSFEYKRKLAVAFAVYSNLSLDQVIHLKWTDEIDVNWRALHILIKVPVCEETDLIFWEKMLWSNPPTPMHSLKITFEIFSHLRWDQFVDKFKDSVPIEFDRIFTNLY